MGLTKFSGAIKCKYAIIPGYVKSQYDGQVHYVDAPQLMRLYGVRRDDCIIVHKELPTQYPTHYIPLAPREDGAYKPVTCKRDNIEECERCCYRFRCWTERPEEQYNADLQVLSERLEQLTRMINKTSLYSEEAARAFAQLAQVAQSAEVDGSNPS